MCFCSVAEGSGFLVCGNISTRYQYNNNIYIQLDSCTYIYKQNMYPYIYLYMYNSHQHNKVSTTIHANVGTIVCGVCIFSVRTTRSGLAWPDMAMVIGRAHAAYSK